MDIVTRDLVRQLAAAEGFPSLSAYLPTSRGGGEQDPVRLQNILKKAHEALAGREGWTPARIDDFLDPIDALLDESAFWQHVSDGLALFRTERFFLGFRLPRAFPELVAVEEHFRLLPLIPLLQEKRRYYVLALSQKEARLIAVTGAGASEIPLKEAHRNLRGMLGLEKGEKSLQFHGVGGRGGIFHGQGAYKDHEKDEVAHYLREVDAEVSALLREERSPLVVAATETAYGLFQGICSYKHLFPEHIPGNPELLRPEELAEAAKKLLAPIDDREMRETADRYHESAAGGRATDDIGSIARAAAEGRIDTLLLSEKPSAPGSVDHAAGEERFFDDIARRTLLGDGLLWVWPRERMPTRSPIAAILRY